MDLAGVDVIAVSYLEVSGSPAKLRYLVRRLRARAPNTRIVVGLWPQGEAALSDTSIQQVLGARAPNTRIVVGLWPQGEAALSDTSIQQVLGADRYVSSLKDAIADIVKSEPHLNAA